VLAGKLRHLRAASRLILETEVKLMKQLLGNLMLSASMMLAVLPGVVSAQHQPKATTSRGGRAPSN
jgi:hypothetical protein